MEIFDPYIREELMARLEQDPSALSFYNAADRKCCLTLVVIAFACGFTIGAWWFA